jgi:hypothetical protein
LAPVLLELLIWAARHENTAAPCALIDHMEEHREQVLAEARRRWQERDLTPLIPRLDSMQKRATRKSFPKIQNQRQERV